MTPPRAAAVRAAVRARRADDLHQVSNQMRIAQEEIFGPVLVVIPYDTVDHAIELANASRYGLEAGIWTSNVTNAAALARRLRVGTARINGADAPLGCFKHSGLGRELGPEGLHHYLETKTVTGRHLMAEPWP